MINQVIIFFIYYKIIQLWAELLRFGDREFYKVSLILMEKGLIYINMIEFQDWWNIASINSYWRNWNLIVQDWLYAYAYCGSLVKNFFKQI